jgi:hypothetical protein
MHPRGELDHAVFDVMEQIYKRLRKLDPWTDRVVPITDVAVVAPSPGFKSVDIQAHARNMTVLKGAARLLCELKVQFNVLTDIMPWEGYRLLVLPDHRTLDEAAARKVRRHLDAGGAILSTGWSGLDPAHGDFVFREWGVKFRGDDTHNPAYYRVEPPLDRGVPDMAHDFYAAGTAIEALEGTQVLARVVAPYYNRHWDGAHGFVYLPPDKPTDQAAVTLRGTIAHVSHAVFRAYFESAPVPLKQTLANLLDILLPDPLVLAPGLPSFARATVMSQEKRRMVHLLSYVPERRGPNMDMIEEPIELRDVILALRVDGREPKRIYLAPQEEALPLEMVNGYVRTTVPTVPGHALVVFEQ